MNYIIDPRVFYWIDVINDLEGVCVVLLILSGIGSIILFAFSCEEWDKDVACRLKKWCAVSTVLSVVLILAVIFIPDRKTMIEMLIAKHATMENTELCVQTIKDLVDYIVNAMQSVT